jgi:hypothetical protein
MMRIKHGEKEWDICGFDSDLEWIPNTGHENKHVHHNTQGFSVSVRVSSYG